MRDQILTVARTYCDARGLSPSRVSTLVFNDGKKIGAIEAGGDLLTDKFEQAMVWFSDHWPDKATWPADIARPEVSEPAEAH